MPNATAWIGPATLTDPIVYVPVALLLVIVGILAARVLLAHSDRRGRETRLAASWQALGLSADTFGQPEELPIPQILGFKFAQTVRGVESLHQLLQVETTEGLQASLVVVQCKVMRKQAGGGQKLTLAHVHMVRIAGIGLSMPDFVLKTRAGGMLGMSVGRLKQDPRFDKRYACEGEEFARIRDFFKAPMLEVALGFLDAPRRGGLLSVSLEAESGSFVGPRIESDGRQLLVSRPHELASISELSAQACAGKPLTSYHRRIVCEGLAFAQAIRAAQSG